MKTHILIAAIAAGIVATAAQAEGSRDAGGPGGPRIDFSELDANSDGQLTLEELQNTAAARFAAADTDADGGLSAAEIAANAIARVSENAATRAAEMIARLDDNDDGLLQADEMQPRHRGDRAERMFEHLDEDEDGVVTKAEFDAAAEKIGERRADRRHRN